MYFTMAAPVTQSRMEAGWRVGLRADRQMRSTGHHHTHYIPGAAQALRDLYPRMTYESLSASSGMV